MTALPAGHSGYFSTPSATLDPSLFDGQHLKPEVREWLLDTLGGGLRRYLDLRGVIDWLYAWLAGSGITYQWGGDRGNGDLDVLFGVDMTQFTLYNPEYAGLPESYVADHVDQVLKQKLWPITDHQQFGQQVYEVTFFWNPETGRDITRIHPYAAYDLKGDAWVVPPPRVPDDPRALYPDEWYQAAKADVDAAESIASHHASLQVQLASTTSPSQVATLITQIKHTREAAESLFNDIHLGRRAAFGEQGRGYGDWANFRWQHAKATGVITGLKGIVAAKKAAEATDSQNLYGGPISGPEQILTRAMLDRGNHPYLR